MLNSKKIYSLAKEIVISRIRLKVNQILETSENDLNATIINMLKTSVKMVERIHKHL